MTRAPNAPARTPTPAQQRACGVLHAYLERHDRHDVHAREAARVLWPDSPAWRRRCKRGGAGGPGGAIAGGLQMTAGAFLRRLVDAGLARDCTWYHALGADGYTPPAWGLTAEGERVARAWLAAHRSDSSPAPESDAR